MSRLTFVMNAPRLVLQFICGIAVVAAWLTPSSSAEIIFYQGPGALQPEENVLFNGPSLLNAGTTVQGITNQSALIANFSSSAYLETKAQGQARIEGATGNLQDLTFSLDHYVPFTEFEFNVRIPNNTRPAPTFTMTVTDVGGNLYTSTNYTLGNGQNFFSVAATNGMAIREISLVASAPIVTQFQQFRVTAIPEPSSLLIASAALIGMFGLRRRR